MFSSSRNTTVISPSLYRCKLDPKLWPYAVHYVVLLFNSFPRTAFDNHNSPNNAYGDSYDFSKLYVLVRISHTLQPSKLLQKPEKQSVKGLFPGIDPTGYQVLDLHMSHSLTLPRRAAAAHKFVGMNASKTTGKIQRKLIYCRVDLAHARCVRRSLSTHETMRLPKRDLFLKVWWSYLYSRYSLISLALASRLNIPALGFCASHRCTNSFEQLVKEIDQCSHYLLGEKNAKWLSSGTQSRSAILTEDCT